MTVRFVFLLHVLLLYRSYLAAKDRVPCETLIAPLWRPCVVVVVVINSVDVSYYAQFYTYSDAFSTTLKAIGQWTLFRAMDTVGKEYALGSSRS